MIGRKLLLTVTVILLSWVTSSQATTVVIEDTPNVGDTTVITTVTTGNPVTTNNLLSQNWIDGSWVGTMFPDSSDINENTWLTGKDGKYASVPCIGNLKVLDSKSDLTLIFRYSVKVDKLVEWQTVTIDDSARKWVEYNDKKGKSNFSSLKCKGYDLEGNLVDFNDIKCYSGKIKPNKSSIDKNGKFRQGWVGFKREVLA